MTDQLIGNKPSFDLVINLVLNLKALIHINDNIVMIYLIKCEDRPIDGSKEDIVRMRNKSMTDYHIGNQHRPKKRKTH